MISRLLRRALAILALAATTANAHAALPPGVPPPIDFEHLPWTDGESVTYAVTWGALRAAEGTFVAHRNGDHWEFRLQLGSRGAVEDTYPFRGYFWSILTPPPWRSAEYGEFRFEPRRTIKERTRIDYPAHLGTRENWARGETKTFPVSVDSIDDVGTLLYHIRAMPWQPRQTRIFHVYESDSEKEAIAECQAVESRAFGTWPRQPLLRLQVLPGKGTHHRGSLMLWMTDDARHLPLHADLVFRYGTFSIDLVKVQ